MSNIESAGLFVRAGDQVLLPLRAAEKSPSGQEWDWIGGKWEEEDEGRIRGPMAMVVYSDADESDREKIVPIRTALRETREEAGEAFHKHICDCLGIGTDPSVRQLVELANRIHHYEFTNPSNSKQIHLYVVDVEDPKLVDAAISSSSIHIAYPWVPIADLELFGKGQTVQSHPCRGFLKHLFKNVGVVEFLKK